MLQLDNNRVCKSTTPNTLENEVFIRQNTYDPVITDQVVFMLFLEKTNLTKQNRFDDSSQLYTEIQG
jgi:hypothetical protein